MKKLTKYILSEKGGTVASKDELKEICKRFRASVDKTVNFMISYGYLIRILRGLYYVKSIEEFKFKKSINTLKLISLGMSKLKTEWYFGLHTALVLNGLTHEYSATTFVMSNRIYRAKPININNEKVKFIKLKPALFGFGVVEKDSIKFSDVEKTLLDEMYISRYRSVPAERIISIMEEYGKNIRKSRLSSYLRFYPKSVRKVVEDAGII